MDGRKAKKLKTVRGGMEMEDEKAEGTEECVEALLKMGLVEPDLWYALRLVSGSGGGHKVGDFVEMLSKRSATGSSVFDEVGKEGESFKFSLGTIHSTKPTKALLKEFMRIIGFLAWNDVDCFGKAKEDCTLGRTRTKKGRKG